VSLDFTEVTVSGVARHYGRRKALSQISFSCHAGEIVGLLGPNGAGKSTLLAILATLLAPSTGQVTYGGTTAAAAGAMLRARIGLLGHDLFLYPELTARENLLFFARLHGVADPVARVGECLALAKLSERAHDQVLGFSRGMRQRLALERALVHAPRLLLLDEPFTGLDDASTLALIGRLRELRSAGCIMLVATHDLDVGEAVFDRAVILHDGRLIASEGDVRNLRKRYQDRLQAGAAS